MTFWCFLAWMNYNLLLTLIHQQYIKEECMSFYNPVHSTLSKKFRQTQIEFLFGKIIQYKKILNVLSPSYR